LRDRKSIFKYYHRYLKGGVGSNKFYEFIDPYVHLQARNGASRIGLFRSFQREEAIQNVRSRVWDAVRRKRLPHTSLKSFFSYLNSIIVREVSNVSHKREYPPLVMEGVARRSNQNLSHKVFLGELPSVLRKRVINSIHVRFPDLPLMASKFVLDRILNGEFVSSSWIRRQYKVRDTKLFLESIIISLRIEIYKIMEDVYPLSNSLRDTLYGSFVESYYEDC